MSEPIPASKRWLDGLEAVGHQPYRANTYFAHPNDKAHLEKHNGGQMDCMVCTRIWYRLTGVR